MIGEESDGYEIMQTPATLTTANEDNSADYVGERFPTLMVENAAYSSNSVEPTSGAMVENVAYTSALAGTTASVVTMVENAAYSTNPTSQDNVAYMSDLAGATSSENAAYSTDNVAISPETAALSIDDSSEEIIEHHL
jgi:hypothetical protein